jgi:2-polyprenyl-6-methoxyphenol hydroxylase-like FAD-dependent oxidoreductase
MLRYGDTKRRPDGTYEVPEVDMTFDVIVVGARVAGAATGMLLARAGLRVLVVDQAHFPSDTLSTHQIQVPGVARLARFGLLQPLLDAGTPPTPHVRFQRGGAVVDGEFPAYQGVNMMISPRRTILDALLVDAARAAGAEVREACSLVNLVKDRDRVGGVQLRDRGNGRVVGRTRGTSDLPNLVRAAYGPGWALAGDAGLVMDPITGLGIGHALRDAELLSSAIVSGLAGSRHLNGSMKGYEKQRNHQTKAAFNWTLDVAGLRGVNEIEEGLFRTIGADEEEASQFFGMLTGVVPMRSFFSPAHLIRLIGVRDFLHLARARSRQEPSEPPG